MWSITAYFGVSAVAYIVPGYGIVDSETVSATKVFAVCMAVPILLYIFQRFVLRKA